MKNIHILIVLIYLNINDKKRINTDLFIKISIMENGEAADLSNSDRSEGFVICPSTSIKKVKNILFQIITLLFNSLVKNTTLGTYGIVVEYNRTSSGSETGYMHIM